MRSIFLAPVLALALLLTPASAHAQGATWRLLFDASNAGFNSGNGYKTSNNASGTLAWGESYIMMSYAAMYRATGDPAYLLTLADHALNVLDQRDNKKGLKDWAGKARPCWQSSKYSANKLGYCWVVHSGMLIYPMADLVLLANQSPALKALPVPNSKLNLGQAAAAILTEVKAVVATHDYQYKTGPKSGEGYYRGDPGAKATVPSVAGKALPLNQMNAMGRALVLLWKVTGYSPFKAKAQGMATYFKNRLKLKGSSYVWTYWGSAWSQNGGEDISHAAINADFAALCHQHGLVFSSTDMVHLAKTLIYNVHLSNDQAADRVDGSGSSNKYRWAVGRWLNLSPFDARVWPVAANIFRSVTKASAGQNFLGMANLCRYAPRIWHYSFYSVDWKDLGDHRKAVKYGANILTLPPDPKKPLALRLGYRASVAASIDQWEGKAKKYHLAHRLAKTGSAFSSVYTPFWPGIYYPYTAKKEVLFQFTDKFVVGKGIEVKEVKAVTPPLILTKTLPQAKVGQPYAFALKGSGDGPLLWSVMPPVPGVKIGLKSGALTWTPAPAQAPGTVIKVRLRNDSGQAERTFNVMVVGIGPDAGPPPVDAAPPLPDAPPLPADGAPSVDLGDASVGTDNGCECRATGRASDFGLAWSILMLLGIWIRSCRGGPPCPPGWLQSPLSLCGRARRPAPTSES